jgi:hypothetical protein
MVYRVGHLAVSDATAHVLGCDILVATSSFGSLGCNYRRTVHLPIISRNVCPQRDSGQSGELAQMTPQANSQKAHNEIRKSFILYTF